jgi:DNA-binding MarR family transcriptional regulator
VNELESQFQNLDLIDTLSERHLQLRRMAEELWNNRSNIYLSNTEWFIIARVYKQETTISHVTKQVDISRQATHKFIKRLEAKGLAVTFNKEHNKKDKFLRLTTLGEDCYEKNEALKTEIEAKVATSIGIEQLNTLREILKLDWGLE